MKRAPSKKKAARKKTVSRKLRRGGPVAPDDYASPEFAEKLTAHFFAAKRIALGYAK